MVLLLFNVFMVIYVIFLTGQALGVNDNNELTTTLDEILNKNTDRLLLYNIVIL